MNGEVDGTNKDFPATHYDTRRKPRRPYSNTLNAGEIVSFPSAKTASTKRKRTSGVFNSNGTDVKRQTESFTRNSIVVTTKDGHDEYSYLLQDQTELHRNGLSIFTGLEAQLIILDCIFLVCEPPSEPYYLGRIMEFTKLSQSSSTIDAVRVNWFYRPRDIQRQQIDARLVFATMHSDLSPLSSIRGKCQILHRSQIENLDLYRTKPDSFFYERLFDKFMRRQYEVLPVDSVINVPEQVRRVLQARWKFVVVEVNRGKELAMEHRACRRCNNWCSSKDSVRCAICKADFHMQCVQPPLPRKPTRGFAWSCTPCSRAEAKRVADSQMSSLEVAQHSEVALHTNLEKADRDSSVSASDDDALSSDNAGKPKASHNASATICDDMDCARPELWPYRYLGIHCNINDAIDHDDRIYPRAASRIGQKHQATVPDWPGRHIEYFERLRRPIKRTAKAMKGKRSDERASLEYSSIERLDSSMNQDFAKSLSKQTIPGRQTSPHGIHQAQKITEVSWHSAVTSVPLPADRPAWLLEKPLNYVARGEGATSACLWKPSEAISDSFLSGYLVMLQPIAKKLKVDWHTSNLLDIALTTLYEREFDAVAAIQILTKLNRKAIGEPTFSADETSRFQASVKLNGSELSIVAQDVGTRTVAECVRFYYAWKKTPQGAAIWRNSDGRKPKAEASQINVRASGSDFETLGDSSDDSAYSTKKATKCRRSFQCKFCTTTESRRWRRAPGGSSNGNLVVALCERCARLWRKYAATWEPPEEIFRKLHDGGYKAKRKRFEEELLKELPSNGSKPEKVRDNSGDQVKCYKKSKKVEKESRQVSPDIIASASCMVCCGGNSAEYRTCTDCGLQVHPGCYGVDHSQGETSDWRCDTCLNDISPAVSTDYSCVLCKSQTKSIHKPRGALKRTAGNNWAHITCAVWLLDLSFGNASTFSPIEGISALPLARWQNVHIHSIKIRLLTVKICGICKSGHGACVQCAICATSVHVQCALQHNYLLAFDLQPIKSSQSRRESLTLVRIGAEGGLMQPILCCAAHDVQRPTIHAMNEVTNHSGQSVLSLYIKTYRTNDSTTGFKMRTGFERAFNTSNVVAIELRAQEFRGLRTMSLEGSPNLSEPPVQESNHRCSLCNIQYSPLFFDVGIANSTKFNESTTRKEICHRCHWRQQTVISQSLGPPNQLAVPGPS